MDHHSDDPESGRRQRTKFIWGGVIGLALIGAARAYSSTRIDVDQTIPIAAPPDNAGAPKPAG